MYQFYSTVVSLSVSITDAERRAVTLTTAETIQKERFEHSDDINGMEWKQATLTTLTVDQQQRDRCINYINFDAGESLSVNWQRPKQLDKHEWSTAMENME